jgi:hypothetical protein
MVDAVPDTNTVKIKNDALRIPVDREHGGIRAVGCASLLIGAVLIYALLETLILNVPVLSVLLALLGSAGLSYVLERYLRGRWPSGREVIISDERIALLNQGDVERQVNPQKHVNVLAWYFEVTRTTRVKKGWYVIGFALEQDDEYIPTYTFMPPDDFDETDYSHYFTELERDDKRKKKAERSTASGMRRVGLQRRLYEAELDRGYAGAEMTREQFEQYLTHLHAEFPGWMPDA